MKGPILLLLLASLALSLAFSPEKHQLLGWERVGDVKGEQSVLKTQGKSSG